ncbi:hypothetical protein A2188_01755 [Candidatus Woesebacteria bacterium RIFOXYA1_FULL_43_9]|uniref:Uncharacterized protein n=1 Tax=Candidatus Woesebacteria bacterium RIFOXYA1_FULL_43_9 TaxID=1802534 RepID=A0A1F8CJ39_9BACT|nr:MAG: hypothetical protein A2188_01755 [Candidatus Woesebacteria bacterium RIFOXYA1_FULL_43_9]
MLNCPKDSYYPICEVCRPNDRRVCPFYNGGPSSRARSSGHIGGKNPQKEAFAFGGDLDDTPIVKPEDLLILHPLTRD